MNSEAERLFSAIQSLDDRITNLHVKRPTQLELSQLELSDQLPSTCCLRAASPTYPQ